MGRKAFPAVTPERLAAFKAHGGRDVTPYVIGPIEAALAMLGMFPFPKEVKDTAEKMLTNAMHGGVYSCLDCGAPVRCVGHLVVLAPEGKRPEHAIAGVCCYDCAPDREAAERIKDRLMAELGYVLPTHEAPERAQ